MKINSRYKMVMSSEKVAVVDMVMMKTRWSNIEDSFRECPELNTPIKYLILGGSESYATVCKKVKKITGTRLSRDEITRVSNELRTHYHLLVGR